MKLGERLLELRQEIGLNQREFGELFNISSVRYSHYETDKRTPDIDLIIDFANYYNVSVDYIVGNSNIRDTNQILKDETLSLVVELDEIDKAEIRGQMKQMLKHEKYKDKKNTRMA